MGSPEWDAHTNASSRGSTTSPHRNIPTACSGLLLDLANIWDSTSPTAQSTCPSGASATTEPRWCPSTKPERTTSATVTGALADTAGEPTRGHQVAARDTTGTIARVPTANM